MASVSLSVVASHSMSFSDRPWMMPSTRLLEMAIEMFSPSAFSISMVISLSLPANTGLARIDTAAKSMMIAEILCDIPRFLPLTSTTEGGQEKFQSADDR